MAGRQILGKPGNSNIIREAIYSDLGWLSIRSYLRLSKLRFFGRLLCLPNDRLAKRVFLLSAAHFDSCKGLKPLSDLPESWCKDTFTILCNLSLQSWWFDSIPSNLASPLAFKRAIKTHVSKLDLLEWKVALNEPPIVQTGLSAREHYKRLKELKTREPYLYTGDRKSALFKFYLRSRTFGLNARTQHGDLGPQTDARKAGSLCDSQCREDEMHFILVCPAYASARRLMWLNIEGNLLQDNLHKEWLDISLSPPRLQLDYLLGKTNSSWHSDTASVNDRHFRQFVLSAASSRRIDLEGNVLSSRSLLSGLRLMSFSTSFRIVIERTWTPRFCSSTIGHMRRLLVDLD
jgi:hypothetical protein